MLNNYNVGQRKIFQLGLPNLDSNKEGYYNKTVDYYKVKHFK